MKIDIDNNGTLLITAESMPEVFAIKYICEKDPKCPECGQMKLPIMFDTSIQFKE